MEKIEAKKRIEYLIKTLSRYNYNYYVENSPVVTEYENDTLYHELRVREGIPEFRRVIHQP